MDAFEEKWEKKLLDDHYWLTKPPGNSSPQISGRQGKNHGFFLQLETPVVPPFVVICFKIHSQFCCRNHKQETCLKNFRENHMEIHRNISGMSQNCAAPNWMGLIIWPNIPSMPYGSRPSVGLWHSPIVSTDPVSPTVHESAVSAGFRLRQERRDLSASTLEAWLKCVEQGPLKLGSVFPWRFFGNSVDDYGATRDDWRWWTTRRLAPISSWGSVVRSGDEFGSSTAARGKTLGGTRWQGGVKWCISSWDANCWSGNHHLVMGSHKLLCITRRYVLQLFGEKDGTIKDELFYPGGWILLQCRHSFL